MEYSKSTQVRAILQILMPERYSRLLRKKEFGDGFLEVGL